MAARSAGLARQDRRRAAGAGRPIKAALASFQAIACDLRASGQGRSRRTRAGSATCRLAHEQQSATCSSAQGDLAGGAGQSYQASPRHRRAAGEGRPRATRGGSTTCACLARARSATCSSAQGDLCGGAASLPGLARDRRPSGEGGPRATRAGSATCRCRTTRSATCWQAQGDLAAALASYQASLAIAERLAKEDPGQCAGWQRDLAISYRNVALAQMRKGRREDALKFLGQGREIIMGLLQRLPDNPTLRGGN